MRQRPCFALTILLLACNSIASAAAGSRHDRAIEYLQALKAQSGAPGVAAVVAIDGRIEFSAGVGVADLQTGMKQSGEVVHNIGSTSKAVAVVGLMQLVERGKVDLDAEIQTYAPWFPRKDQKITVRHLLTHTSGIGHYDQLALDRFPAEMRYRFYADFAESTRTWRDQPLLFEPGQYWHYSSFATSLMHAIIEHASGEPFEAYLRRNVWERAGMRSTQFDVSSRIVPKRERSYARHRQTGELENDPGEDVSYKYASGGMLSTDEDLARFGHALNSGRLLRAETLAAMYRPQLQDTVVAMPPADGRVGTRAPDGARFIPARGQALIWRVGSDSVGRFAHHGGLVKSTSTQFVNYIDDDVTVALHFNSIPIHRITEQAAEGLARIFVRGRSARSAAIATAGAMPLLVQSRNDLAFEH